MLEKDAPPYLCTAINLFMKLDYRFPELLLGSAQRVLTISWTLTILFSVIAVIEARGLGLQLHVDYNYLCGVCVCVCGHPSGSGCSGLSISSGDPFQQQFVKQKTVVFGMCFSHVYFPEVSSSCLRLAYLPAQLGNSWCHQGGGLRHIRRKNGKAEMNNVCLCLTHDGDPAHRRGRTHGTCGLWRNVVHLIRIWLGKVRLLSIMKTWWHEPALLSSCLAVDDKQIRR